MIELQHCSLLKVVLWSLVPAIITLKVHFEMQVTAMVNIWLSCPMHHLSVQQKIVWHSYVQNCVLCIGALMTMHLVLCVLKVLLRTSGQYQWVSLCRSVSRSQS